MEYVLDQIGAPAFKVLVSHLVAELTGHALEVVDSKPLRMPPYSDTVTFRWPDFLGGDVWSGHVLVDVAYVPHPELGKSTKEIVTAQLRSRIDQEERSRAAEAERRARELSSAGENAPPARAEDVAGEDFPDYLILVTNFPLGPAGGRAALDVLRSEAGGLLGVRACEIWDRNTIWKMLDAAPKTRRRYLPSMAPADVITRLDRYDVGVNETLLQLFKLQMINELTADQWVRLSQTGDVNHAKLALSQVGIDLPVKDQGRTAARLIIEAADAASPFRRSDRTANLLLQGGPGQGKSTIAQLLGQCYRVALLEDSIEPRTAAHTLIGRLKEGLKEAGIPLPRYRRWPVRIDLANYVDAAVNYQKTSLIAYIAEQANKRAQGIHGPRVKSWLKAWPWLLILDGFDEVASARGRETLMDQISNFTNEVEMLGADVFVVATTRPQGYAGEFRQLGYHNIELAPLDVRRAVNYGLKIAQARHVDDPDMREKVSDRLNSAANDKLTARLMRSPLQVTIMSILLEARERVPRARYELFEAYYDAIYARESSKTEPLRELLEKRRSDINALHNRLGLLLQVNSEKAGGLDASIPYEELRRNAVSRLEDEGHDHQRAVELADEIVTAVTRRLVLIVPTKLDDVGFEVRSIQEFFAARAIVTGEDRKVVERLGRIIEPAHWRNTWLFAAGKAFLEREHIRRDLLQLLRDIDNRDLIRMVVAPGADLALDLLEDDVAAHSPVLQRDLYRQALELVKYPPDPDLRRRALVFFQIAEGDKYLALQMENAISQAIAGTPGQFDAAHAVLQPADLRTGKLAYRFRPTLREMDREARSRQVQPVSNARAIVDVISAALANATLTPADYKLVDELIAKIAALPDQPPHGPSEEADTSVRDIVSGNLLDSCLTREPIANLLAQATVTVAGSWSWAGSELRNLLRSWMQRGTAGPDILRLTFD